MREPLRLVANNPMRIAGFQGIYGDPCGIEFIPVSLSDALCVEHDPVMLIDAGSVAPLFGALTRFSRKRSRAQLVVVGVDADDTYIECVIGAGARGFVGATAPANEFRNAIENVQDGGLWAPRRVLSRIIGRQAAVQTSSAPPMAGDVVLTPREAEVLGLLVQGSGNREIGATLGIDSTTVKGHLGRMMRKAGVGNRVELTMYALHRRRNSAWPVSRTLRSG